jgi:hypothetical protein
MKNISGVLFLMVMACYGYAQENPVITYRYVSRREVNTITIFGDSTYAGRITVGINRVVADSGTC